MPRPPGEYTSIKAIKEHLGLSEAQMIVLVDRARTFVLENEDDCAEVPRLSTLSHWKVLTRRFANNEDQGKRFIGPDRYGYVSGDSQVWPEDEENVMFSIFCLLKLEAMRKPHKRRTNELQGEGQTGQPMGAPMPQYTGKKNRRPQQPLKEEDNDDDDDNDNDDDDDDDDDIDRAMGIGKYMDKGEVTGNVIPKRNIHHGDPFEAPWAATGRNLAPFGHGSGALEQYGEGQLEAKRSGHKYGSFSMGLSSSSNANRVNQPSSGSGWGFEGKASERSERWCQSVF